MKCENCETQVDSKFEFAIKNNMCPACGKSIMSPESLVSFVALKNLLNENFPDISVDSVASSIVANFEIKQRFRDSVNPSTKNAKEQEVVEASEDVLEGEAEEDAEVSKLVPDSDPDADSKRNQIAESKKILKKLREQALENDGDVTGDDWGLGNANAFVDSDSAADLLDKRKRSQSNFEQGSGAFRRG